jgi:hypothetical protein
MQGDFLMLEDDTAGVEEELRIAAPGENAAVLVVVFRNQA